MNTLDKHIAVRISKHDLKRIDAFCGLHHLDRSALIRSLISGLDVPEKSTNTAYKKGLI